MTDLLLRLRVDPGALGAAAPLVAKLAPLLGLALASLALVAAVAWLTRRTADDQEGRFGRGVLHALLQVPLWVAALVSRWGDSAWSVIVGVVTGLAIALAAAQLGGAVRNLWRARRLTLPFLAGLVWGGGFVATLVEGVWLEGTFWVTDHAVVARCVREREEDYEDQNGNKSTVWVYDSHEDVIGTGEKPPVHAQACRYLGGRERVRFERLDLFGGRFFSERRGAWSPFRWLLVEPRPEGKEIRLERGAQLVRSNFHGRPIRDGLPVAAPIPPPAEGPKPPLELELPDPSRTWVGSTGAFFARLRDEEEFRPYAWFLLSLHAGLVGALFSPRTRGPALAFLLGYALSFVTALVLLVRGPREAAIGALLSAGDVADVAVGAALLAQALPGEEAGPLARLRRAPLTWALALTALVGSLAAARVEGLRGLRAGTAGGVLVHDGPATLLASVAFLALAGLTLEWRVRRWLFALVFAVGGLATVWLERALGDASAAGVAGAAGVLLGLAAALPPPDARARAPLPVSPSALAVWLCLVAGALALVGARGAGALGHLFGLALGLAAGWAVRRSGWEGWRAPSPMDAPAGPWPPPPAP